MSARPVCAYCRQREVEVPYRPFCSKRCQQADLGRWLNGDYRIAVGAADTTRPAPVDLDDDGDRIG